jgi:5'-nucleotidase
VSGINGGLNAGINVLYSGTVAAAIEGAFFDITSVAVSLEYDEHAEFGKAAKVARRVIEQILKQKQPAPQLYNVNIPTAALIRTPEVHVVPMGLIRYGKDFEKRVDPSGRNYYWMIGEIGDVPSEPETDLTALLKGKVTVTPLNFDLTKRAEIEAMKGWKFDLK